MPAQIGSYYRHHRTKNLYRVTEIGKHTETNEETVSYKCIETGETFFRPRAMFEGTVRIELGETVLRFTPQTGKLEPDYIECLLRDAMEGARELSRRLDRICNSLPPWQR